MKGVIKGIVIAVAGLAAVVVLALILLVTLVDPNDYRDDISRIARDKAGVELKLGGELNWRFYPVLGFGATDVGLALSADQPELMHIEEFAVGVRLVPLLSRRIEVDGLDIGGLNATLVVDESGQSNWQMPQSAEAEAPPATGTPPTGTAPTPADESPAGGAPDLTIPLIRIHSSTINYEDKSTKVSYTVDLPLLELEDVNFQEPFPLLLEARLRDQSGLDVNTRLEGKVSALLDSQQFGIEEMSLAAEVGGVFDKPVAVNLQGKANFDQAQDLAEIKVDRLQFASLVARLTVAVADVTSAPVFKGRLETDVINGRELMDALGMEPLKTLDPDALSRVEVMADIEGTPEKVTLKPLVVKLDDSTLKGEVSVVDVSKQAIRFALELDKIDIDQYLPPPEPQENTTEEQANTVTEPGSSTAELIPVETLRGLNLKGTFKAGEVIVQKIPMQDINLSVSAIDGNVQVTDLSANLLEGNVKGTAQVDVRQAQPKIVTRLDLSNIALSALMEPFVSTQLLSGRANLTVDTTTQGNDMDTLLKQALGQLKLNTDRMLVHGVNVNQVALDAVKNKLGNFTALMPNYQERLPTALKSDTEVRDLVANMTVKNGHLLMPDFSADTGEGQLSAAGDINMLEKSFDYQFGVVLSALDDNKYLKGVKWPVRCKGDLESSVKDWCRPDSKAVGQVLEKAATVALRDKGVEKIGEKLGIDNADEDAVKEQLRQKAKEEEDRAKKKLGDSLRKMLEKQ